MGFVNLNIYTIRGAHKFYVISSQTTYHLHSEALDTSPEGYPLYLSLPFEGYVKESSHQCGGSIFQRDEAHFSEAAYFDELIEDGEVTLLDLEVSRC